MERDKTTKDRKTRQDKKRQGTFLDHIKTDVMSYEGVKTLASDCQAWRLSREVQRF